MHRPTVINGRIAPAALPGSRFRRRALRRGYKVEEVDAFLHRAQATLDGAPAGRPVRADNVLNVVFRVRFGGYDEWQVDIYLDRLERELRAREGPALEGQVLPMRAPSLRAVSDQG